MVYATVKGGKYADKVAELAKSFSAAKFRLNSAYRRLKSYLIDCKTRNESRTKEYCE